MRTALLLMAACLLAPGCSGILAVEDNTAPVILPGMGAVACPTDWTGTSLPSDFMADVDTALTTAFHDVQYQIESEISRYNPGPVDSIRLTAFTLRLAEHPDPITNQNSLGFIQEIRIYAESSRAGSTLPRALLAESQAVPPGTTAVVMVPTEVNLAPYFDEGIQISAEITPRTCLAEDIQLRFSYEATIRYLPKSSPPSATWP